MIKNMQSNLIVKESGFSLVELIIATCILSILGSIVVSGFERQNHNARLSNTAQIIINFFESGRRMSLNNSTTCILQVNHIQKTVSINNSQECTGLDSISLSNMFQREEDMQVCGSANISDQEFNCDVNLAPSTTIVFTPKGNASQGAIIKLVSPRTQNGYCIVITEPVGHVMKGRLRDNTCDFSS